MVQDAGKEERALLIVRKTTPQLNSFQTLVLKQVQIGRNTITDIDPAANVKVQVFDQEDPKSPGTAKTNPIEIVVGNPDPNVPQNDSLFWIEGNDVSKVQRDTGFQLGLKGVEDDGDRICTTVCTFSLTVQGAYQVGGSNSTIYVATTDQSQVVTVIADISPTPSPAPPDLVEWTGGSEVPGKPLHRAVSRVNAISTTVTAKFAGSTRHVEIFVVRLTLDVDANRDGKVSDNEAGRNTWEYGAGKTGAIILCNCDADSTGSHIDNEDDVVNGVDDMADLAPLFIRKSGSLPPGVILVLSVSDKEKIRIFPQRIANATAIIGPGSLPSEFTITNSQTADVEFAMEATQYPGQPPDAGFNGEITLTLILKDGVREITKDIAKVRVAPWMMLSHMSETIELYVVETSDNTAFVSEIQSVAISTGVTLRKTVNNDRWMQDTMEIGYSRMPGKENNVVFKSVRTRGLNNYARGNLLGPDFGFVQVVTPTGENTFDSHGNLEVSPPVQVDGKNFKFGRIYYGRGRPTTPFNSEVEQFLIAQKIQKPFKIDTDWLAVGHVDEIISFVPCNKGGNGFKMLFSDTHEAIRILNDLKKAGHGDLKLFKGHAEEISVGDLLVELSKTSPGKLGWANTICQTRLDGVKKQIKIELGLVDSDIVLIPSLFIENSKTPRLVPPFGPPFFDAFIPGMVNLLLINKPSFANIKIVMAKPFGPELGGVDQLEKAVLDKLSALGYSASQLKFVDDYETYHLMLGEVHCGTNSKRQLPPSPWWEQTDF